MPDRGVEDPFDAGPIDGSRLRRFTGPAFLQLETSVTDPLDFSALYETENRWNRKGEPALYLAADPGVALAEFARHTESRDRIEPVTRRMFRFVVDIDGLVDLRGSDAAAFLDRETACAAADRLRASAACRGLIVPSMAFLDSPDRFNLAIFVDRAGDPRGWVRDVREVGILELPG